MTWMKVDDNLAFHRKALKAGNEAMGLWVRAGSWSAQQLSDGVIPHEIVAALGGASGAADRLVAAELWHPHDEGFEFHEWVERQPTRDEVEAKRAVDKERVRVWREAKRSKRNSVTPGVTHTVSNAVDNAVRTSAPTRPGIKEVFIENEQDSAIQQKDEQKPKTVYPAEFEKFWAAYPRRQSKGDALRAWDLLKRKHQLPELDVLVAAAKAYAKSKADSEPQFIKLPAGWLRDRKWEDDIAGIAAPVVDEIAAERATQRAKWLSDRGVTVEEYERRKNESGWLDSLKELPNA